jgi:hypothetical protein
MTAATRWPRDDRVRWIEKRLQERIAFESEEGLKDWVVLGHDLARRDLEVWLAKERDGLSWQQIAIKHFPEYKKTQLKSAGMSKARRTYDLVERALEPSAEESVERHIEVSLKDVFGGTPSQFKKYVEGIRTRKRRK